MLTTWTDYERASMSSIRSMAHPELHGESSLALGTDVGAALSDPSDLSAHPDLAELDEPPPPPMVPMQACTPMTRRRRQAEALERQHAPLSAPSHPLAAEVMRGVMSGEWVITDHFQSEGRRFLIVQRCRPGDGRALSEREREVLALALQGHSNKFVAYELGLTSSTVATHLRRAMAKLRVESREALIQALTIETTEQVAEVTKAVAPATAATAAT